MRRARIGALAARIVRGFRRDPRTLALIVIVPLVVMALIGYLISDDREPLRVAVASGESNETCGAIVSDTAIFRDALAAQPGIEVVEVTTCDEGIAKIEAGELEGIVEYPVIEQGNPIAMTRVIVAGTDPRIEEPIVRAATIALAAARGSPLEPGEVANVSVDRVDVPDGERPSTISYSAPALITVFAFLFTFMLTSVAFLRERSSGTLERLLASPITRAEILSGYLLGFLGFAAIQALLVLAYSTLVLARADRGRALARAAGDRGARDRLREPGDHAVVLRAERAAGDPVHPARAAAADLPWRAVLADRHAVAAAAVALARCSP